MPTPLLGVNSTATLLLTLLNVSATRSDKRKQADEHVERPQKLNKRKTLRFDDSLKGESENVQAPEECPVDIPQTHTNGDADTDESGGRLALKMSRRMLIVICEEIIDFYERQFGVNPVALNDATRNAADNGSWNTLGDKRGNLGSTADSVPEGVDALPHRPFRAFVRIVKMIRLFLS